MNDESDNAPFFVLAIDPGTVKCGVAVVGHNGEAVAFQEIVATAQIAGRVPELLTDFPVTVVVMGDGTGSGAVGKRIAAVLPADVPLKFVPERFSTLCARDLYFALNPPRGWRRLVPAGLRTPPGPIDDYAAILLAREYLSVNPL